MEAPTTLVSLPTPIALPSNPFQPVLIIGSAAPKSNSLIGFPVHLYFLLPIIISPHAELVPKLLATTQGTF